MTVTSRRICVLAGIILALCAAPLAFGHAFSTSYSRITPRGTEVEVQLTLNLADFNEPDVVRMVEENYRLESEEAPLRVETLHYDSIADNVMLLELRYTFARPPAKLVVTSTLDRITQPNHGHIVQIGEGDDAREAVLTAQNRTAMLDMRPKPLFATAVSFVKLGIEHIFTGYDHLAFLAGLLIVTTTLRSLLRIVTAFTFAHSITLALATFDLVAVPARLIESLIALSIAYIAFENFSGKTLVHRWKITFLFGLVHGFGFSNVLKEMALTRRNLAVSLFSFNGGVELGQLAFVALVFPLVCVATRSAWKREFLSATSIAIGALGLFWFVQRVVS